MGPVLGRACLDRKAQGGGPAVGGGDTGWARGAELTSVDSNLMGLSGRREIKLIPSLHRQD